MAASVTLSNEVSQPNLGLQIEGLAVVVSGNVTDDLARKHLDKRGKTNARIDEILKDGHAWYKLQPTKIEIINEPLWGFEKHTVEF